MTPARTIDRAIWVRIFDCDGYTLSIDGRLFGRRWPDFNWREVTIDADRRMADHAEMHGAFVLYGRSLPPPRAD